ncbi:MAG: CNNM domain-containing protein, partial [Solirubrobacterales bacterium]
MTILLLLLVVLLILVNGFFVAAEFALVRSRHSRMEELAKDGLGSAKLALRQMDHVDEYVAACQVGITFASIGIGFLGEPAIADLIEPVVEGVVGESLAYAISFGFAYLVITLLHVIFGEQAPKQLGIVRAESMMLAIARPFNFFRRAFHPLILITNPPALFIVRKI